MHVFSSELKIKGVFPKSENPLPKFRDSQKNKEMLNDGSLKEEDLQYYGEEIGQRILPYKVQDFYTRKKEDITLKTVVLENDILEAVFLPEVGGRLYSLKEKATGRDLLFTNSVFQPGNLAIRNAWVSGGIEWNVGQYGHSAFTFDTLFCAKLTDDEGNEFLRMYEMERMKGLFFHFDFHLPKGANTLRMYARIVNSSSKTLPMYYWTNIAVKEDEQTRIFSGADEVLYIRPESLDEDVTKKAFGRGTMPTLPPFPGKDISYSMNFKYSNEYFFQTDKSDKAPWEAAVYGDDFTFFERSTSRLRYRKMFCWGSQRGGRNWCDYLSEPNKGDYVEIQGGMAPTQVHGLYIPPETEWDFTQVFGFTHLEGVPYGDENWQMARNAVKEELDKILPPSKIDELHLQYQAYGDKSDYEPFVLGSGWAYLEGLRRQKEGEGALPSGFVFPENSLTEQEQPWLTLLKSPKDAKFSLDTKSNDLSWMTDLNWETYLREAIKIQNDNQVPLLAHLGVMLYENDRYDEAVACWNQGDYLEENYIINRNLGFAAKRAGDLDGAHKYYELSFNQGGHEDRALVEEYFEVLNCKGLLLEVWALYQNLSEILQGYEKIQILVAPAAIEFKEMDFLETFFLRKFALNREGEIELSEFWYQYKAIEEGKDLEKIKKSLTPPKNIDFKMGLE